MKTFGERPAMLIKKLFAQAVHEIKIIEQH
jgi:hypothetical protein